MVTFSNTSGHMTLKKASQSHAQFQPNPIKMCTGVKYDKNTHICKCLAKILLDVLFSLPNLQKLNLGREPKNCLCQFFTCKLSNYDLILMKAFFHKITILK